MCRIFEMQKITKENDHQIRTSVTTAMDTNNMPSSQNVPATQAPNVLMQNKFSNLPEVTDKEPVDIKPPPIFIQISTSCADHAALIALLQTENISATNFVIQLFNKTQIKLSLSTINYYDQVITLLLEKSIEFYSYQKTQDLPYRVVLRGLPISTPGSLIAEFLKKHGHEPVRIHLLRHWKTKEPIPLLEIDLKKAPSNRFVLNIKSFFCENQHFKIIFESPRPKRRNSVLKLPKIWPFSQFLCP